MPTLIEAYLFSELSEESRKNVRDWWLRCCNDDELACDDATEQFEYILAELGLPTDVHWSLSCSQGDGVAFSGAVDVEKYTTAHNLRGWGPIENVCSISITQSGRYTHWNSMDVVCEECYSEDSTDFWTTQFITQLVEHIDQRIKEVSRELEALGYTILDSYRTDEYIDECITTGDQLFSESGVCIGVKGDQVTI